MGILTKIRAGSIVEVTLAMVLLLIAFGISMSIFINVRKSGFNSNKIKFELIVNALAEKTLEDGAFENEEQFFDGVQVIREVRPYRESRELLEIEIRAIGPDLKNIVAQKYLVYVPDKND